MLTSVVIPCHDGADDTRACLEALACSIDTGEVEVVIVDNGSRDPGALAAAAAVHRGARVLRLAANLGFAGGVNAGIEAARGEVIVVLNNDTLPGAHLLARLRRALAASPRPAMAAPVSNYVKGSALLPVGQSGSTKAGRAEIEAALAQSCGGVLQDVDSLAGLCLMFEKCLWREVGPFDVGFGLGNFEDDDFSLRVRLRGGRLVVARDAFLHHWGSKTFTALGIDYGAQLARNHAAMQAKWADDPAWQALAATQSGDVRLAGEWAARAEATHPHWPEATLFRARAAHVAGDHRAAVTLAERHLHLCPASWPGHVVRVLALLGGARLCDATRAASTALLQCYVDAAPAATLLTQLAHGLAAHREYAAARQALAAALELAPSAERHELLGSFCMAAGDLAAAEAAFAAAVAAGGEAARVRLGVCQWQLGRPAAALRSLAHAVTAVPSDERARTALGEALVCCAAAGIDTADAQQALAKAGVWVESPTPVTAARLPPAPAARRAGQR